MEEGQLVLKAKAAAGQRNALALLLAASIMSNGIMAVVALTKDQTTVLVPTVVSDAMQVSHENVSKEYLMAVARDVATTMLNTTAKSEEFVRNTLLPLAAPQYYGALKRQIVERWTEIDRKNLATVFYPTRLTADPVAMTARVQGQVDTYVSDTRTSSAKRTFEIGFELRDGRLFFTRFVEVKDAEK